jgi:hypothetical protein
MVRSVRYVENQISMEYCKDFPSDSKLEQLERKRSALKW